MTEAETAPGGTFVEVDVLSRESVSLAPPPAPSGMLPALRDDGPQGPGGNEPVRLGPRAPQPPPPPPPGVPAHRSTYMNYLPGIYQENDFLGRYLLIVESVLGPITRTVDNVPHIFDPAVTPVDLLPWLAGWVGVVLDDRWPEERRREMVRAAPSLFRWRGTQRGMREFVRIATGFQPEIIEPTLSEVAAARNRAFHFTVRLTVPPGQLPDRASVQAIIDLEKPAFTAGRVEIVEGAS